ncbi:hypothetical protein LAV84_11085 [Rhizobium sp. VS19-DR104.2]|uniref:hypothetical protein n=1 Tax=unclassified Rhizobium TaxID=2613769 RepID=UPI001C5A9FA6|nr:MULTISPECIES: hypothetical protein [unclassified Rhizobium]MBZ5759181.1 hypothetical protein [Rhizobium sp. VS19-DR96]MBZ5763988.1 hypothetical protein [Rhizobium sp. VS19-DR129.2]MBZ5771532.1 hypothetical protein [Rhizobium sp. VS19-DRK62.2]MBZ5783781.1 hypothetical protein [Rhizobium sp. VS19-DR121]MBZ5801545.1 hypothetical protein [Rhizobium sp. VS19-DR181]
MQLNTTSVNLMSASKTPEDAAKFFLGAVSQGLAAVVADALSKAVSNTVSISTKNASIVGWESMIGGLVMELAWATPLVVDAKPMARVTGYAPCVPAGTVSSLGISVGIGVSISATF